MTRPQSKPHARGWWATDAAERDAIGSNDGLDTGDVVFLLSGNTFHRCTSVDGGDASTWTAAGGATPTLSAVLAEGDVTDNQPIRGTNATTSTLSALSLIAGTPTDPTEIGARALLQGGGASSGAVVGGIGELTGGPPPAGQSQQGGLALVHGYDATGVDNRAGDTLVRGGDDEQGGLTTAGTLTCRASNTTGNRNGSPSFFIGGNAGNFSARTGGRTTLQGGLAGFNGIGGTAEVVSGGHLSGTGGSTGPVDVHSLDSDGTFIGTGDVDVHTGDADVSASNKPGDLNLFCGISGLGSGTSGQLTGTAGLQRNNSIPAGDTTWQGGPHSGTNRGGHVNAFGGVSTSGVDGGVRMSGDGCTPVVDKAMDLGKAGATPLRWGFAICGTPQYDPSATLDNVTVALGTQGILIVNSATGAVNLDLPASDSTHGGKTWMILVRANANPITLRRNGSDTINTAAADDVLTPGLWIVSSLGNGDNGNHGPIAIG